MRLDKYVSEKLKISRALSKDLILDGKVKVSGKVLLKPSFLLSNEVVEVDYENSIKAVDYEIEIFYEDDYLMVINKPKGVLSHPVRRADGLTLVNILHGRKLSRMDSDRPGIVHRLDKDTSGLMIVAKDDRTHDYLEQAFKERKIFKEYTALVEENVLNDKGKIVAPLKRFKNKTMVSKDGKYAETHFQVIKRYGDKTLLKVQIITGRTHQIRAHLAWIKHPIINDYLYGKVINEEGLYLHSSKLSFYHPFLKKEMTFESEAEFIL